MTDAPSADASAKAEHEKPPRRRRRGGTPLRFFGVLLSALVVAIVIFCLLFQWDWLRGPIAKFASAQIHRRVKIDGHLRVHLLTWTPTATVGGIEVGQPAWAGSGDMVKLDRLVVAISLPELLKGHVVLPLLELDHPDVSLLQDASMRANWDFSNGKKATGKAAKLPPIQRFVIADGRLSADVVPRRLKLTGTVNAREQKSGGGDQGFTLAGQGTINNRPFLMRVSGGPLLNIRVDRPYPFKADIRAGDTHATADGAITRPFNFGSVQSAVSITGSDMANLYYLTGITLPNTPPYSVRAHIAREETRYDINGLVGRVGSSDLEGDLRVNMAGGRPDLTGALRSRMLDLVDLGTAFGAGTRAKDATAQQKATAQALAAQSRLLPDATLDITRVRAVDAKVDYRAASVKAAANLPLRAVHLGVTLNHGLLDLNPITLGFPQGQLSGNATIDARHAVQRNAIDLRLTGVRLAQFIPAKGAAGAGPPLEGVLQARARLTGTGNSVHKAAATADGNVTAVITHGAIRETFAQLAGVNVVKGLGLLLSKDQHDTQIRCAIADFHATNGLLNARTLVVDTPPSIVRGSGTINLNSEQIALRVEGKPKHFQLVHLDVPVDVNGTLRKPGFSVEAGGVVKQAGIGAALGVFLTPFASVLPFVDLGLAKDADCAAVYTEARQEGTKVHAALPPPSKGPGTPPAAHKSFFQRLFGH